MCLRRMAVAGAVTAALILCATPIGGRAGALARVHVTFAGGALAKPPTDASCRRQFGTPCYSPQEMRRAYGVGAMLARGDIGRGETIAIVDSFGSPTIASDLIRFDRGYGIADPPSFKIYAPLGTVPFDPANRDRVLWALETTLDVEWAHAMAPGASIALFTSPVDETQGVQGMPQFLSLERYALDHHLADVISQSWGTTENTLFNPAGDTIYDSFEALYQRAARLGVTVLASTGDTGTANPDVNGNIYPFPTVLYPASSPWVTAVGGTSLVASTSGDYQSEVVWNNGGGATGGGRSQRFAEPSWQRSLPYADQRILAGHRGIPDVAFNADPNTPVLVFAGFLSPAGFYAIGGTSEGSPMWAGIVADAGQAAGHPLGYLDPLLYRVGTSGDPGSLLHDVTVGTNAGIDGLPGYRATAGWDPTTGWGTPSHPAALLNA